MRSDDVRRLRDALERGISLVLDGSGRIHELLGERRAKARFYGIGYSWEEQVGELVKAANEVRVEIVKVAPAVSSAIVEVQEPLSRAEASLAEFASAIGRYESSIPAGELFHRELEEVAARVSRLRERDSSAECCPICGVVSFTDGDRLEKHFEQGHVEPSEREMCFVPVADQIAAVNDAAGSYRQIYDDLVQRLSDTEAEPEPDGSDRAEGGARPHPWRDIVKEQYRAQLRSASSEGSKAEVARGLIAWAREKKLPLVTRKGPPVPDTVQTWMEDVRKEPLAKRTAE